jgi:hypothetical protein
VLEMVAQGDAEHLLGFLLANYKPAEMASDLPRFEPERKLV